VLPFEMITNDFVVGASIANVRSDADDSAEVVTQALMNTTVQTGEVRGDWTHVSLVDYAGWIRSDQLAFPIVRGYCEGEGTCGVPLPYSVVVTATHTPLYVAETGDEQLGEVYLSTMLPYIDLAHQQRLRVALPGDSEAWLEHTDVVVRANHELFPQQDIHTVTSYARSFLSVPYLWGGTSWLGIDCSGLVQLCYRMGGDILPRDADQQYAFLEQKVAREEMRAGDLIFFGREHITHVAMALNRHEYIHAEGVQFEQVIIHSLDDRHPDYNEHLANLVYGIKRVRPIQ
jgi:gamma-D-glutamyl-L-lysine dipeptidyl-peptidase